MTKYMKITRTEGTLIGSTNYIDLYKINRIRFLTKPCEVRVPHESDESLENYVSDTQYFSTHFSIPGERDMEVFGPAHEFIAHIEEQQKRARKGKEVEPYEPDGNTVYTSDGKVHPVNDLLAVPAYFHESHPRAQRRGRELNSQIADYIRQIIDCNRDSSPDWSDSSKEIIDLWEEATREVEEGTLSVDGLQVIHKAVRPIVAKAVQYQREASAA